MVAHANGVHASAQPRRHEAGGGHDDEHVERRADQHGDERRADDFQHIRHVVVYKALDLCQQEHANHNRQHTALPRHEDGAERRVGVVKPQERGDVVDVAHGGDHAQHAAQDGSGAELLGGAIARPCREVGKQRLLDEEQQVVQAAPDHVVGIARHELLDDHGKTAADARHDEAGNHRHEDASEDFAEMLDPHAEGRLSISWISCFNDFLSSSDFCSFRGLGTCYCCTCRVGCRNNSANRKAFQHVLNFIRVGLGFSWAHHYLVIGMLVVHQTKNCRVLLDSGLINEGFIGNGYTEPSHAIRS